jgi:UPF0716 family protein affecting phage T7 exclusion
MKSDQDLEGTLKRMRGTNWLISVWVLVWLLGGGLLAAPGEATHAIGYVLLVVGAMGTVFAARLWWKYSKVHRAVRHVQRAEREGTPMKHPVWWYEDRISF